MVRTPKEVQPSTLGKSALRDIVQNLYSCEDARALLAAKTLLQHAQTMSCVHVQIFKAKAVKPLVHLLSRDTDDLRIIAAKVLRVIGNTHKHIKGIVDAGAMEPLVTMLQSNNNRCRETATMAIHRFASYRGFEHQIADAGPIPMLVQMIIRKDIGAWNLAIAILGDLAAAYGLEKLIGCDEKGIEHLIELVHMYDQDMASAKKAVAALWNISTPDELKHFIATQEALEKLVAMLLHVTHIDDATDVLGLLGNLTAVTNELRQRVADAGAIEAIVKMLHLPTHTDESDSQVCAILHNLSLCDGLQPLIVQAGALAPMIKLLRSESRLCQRRAANAIFNISVWDEMEKLLYEAGAIAPLLELLHRGCEKSQDVAAGTLWNISCFREGKQAIASIEMIFPQLAQYLANDDGPHKIGESCFRMLEHLELLQLPPHVHLKQGTILALRSSISRQASADPRPYVEDYLSHIILKHTHLQEAMNMLADLAQGHELAFIVCASILVSCDRTNHYVNPMLIPDPIAPAAFATTEFRTILTPLLVCALSTNEPAVRHTFVFWQKLTVRLQIAHAIHHVLQVHLESTPLDDEVDHEPTGTKDWHDHDQISRVPTDLVLIVDNERFEVHTFMMHLRSDLLHKEMTFPKKHRCSEIVLKDPEGFKITAHVFGVLLHFLYTGSVEKITPHISQDVLTTADYLGMSEKSLAVLERHLIQQINTSNALRMFTLAHEYPLPRKTLERLSIDWILMNLVHVVIAEEEREASIQTGQDDSDSDGDGDGDGFKITKYGEFHGGDGDGVVKLNRTIVKAVVEAFFSKISLTSHVD